jgi:hypothetical protein
MRSVRLQLVLGLLALAPLVPSDTLHAQERKGPTLEATLQCIDLAARQTDLVPDQRASLCFAASSASAPVACWLEATQVLDLTDEEGLLLCRCTSSLAPVACVHDLRNRWLATDPEMIALCSPAITLGLRLDCSPIP